MCENSPYTELSFPSHYISHSPLDVTIPIYYMTYYVKPTNCFLNFVSDFFNHETVELTALGVVAQRDDAYGWRQGQKLYNFAKSM